MQDKRIVTIKEAQKLVKEFAFNMVKTEILEKYNHKNPENKNLK